MLQHMGDISVLTMPVKQLETMVGKAALEAEGLQQFVEQMSLGQLNITKTQSN